MAEKNFSIDKFLISLRNSMIEQRLEGTQLKECFDSLPKEVVDFIEKAIDTADLYHNVLSIKDEQLHLDRFIELAKKYDRESVVQVMLGDDNELEG